MSINDLAGHPSRGSSRPVLAPRRAVVPPLPGVSAPLRWQRRYVRAVHVSDLATVVLVVTAGLLLRVGAAGDGAWPAGPLTGVAAGGLMIACLVLTRVWDERILGAGTEELRRVSRAFLAAAVLLGLGGLALEVHAVRPWVFGVVPACAALCLRARYGMRCLLHRHRRDMRCMQPVLAVGDHDVVADLIRRTRRDPHFGWKITGVCTPTGAARHGGTALDGVPVVGDLDAVPGLARHGGYRIVAIAPAPGWGPPRLQRLAWELEGTGTELAVDPGVMEIAGPRLHLAPVDGLPLLRLSEPRFSGPVHLFKAAFDRVAAAVLLVVLAVPLLGLTLAVLADGGPAFTVQTRVGLGGRRFRMLTFRTTIAGTDERDAALTRIGAVLRRHAMDELPQLVNVLTGSMSLVGPRPPRLREVATGGPATDRRLLVKPGMTGLSQVSGRGTRTDEEQARLDLRYVENWTAALDASILWKSIGAVVRGRGVL